MWRATYPSTPVADSVSEWLTAPAVDLLVRTGLQHRGRLICPLPWPTHPSLISTLPQWSSTLRRINSGSTHQVKSIQYILYYILLSLKEQLLWLASSPVQDKLCHWDVEWLIPVYITVKYGESQANSSSSLKTRGLQWHDSGTPGHGRGW